MKLATRRKPRPTARGTPRVEFVPLRPEEAFRRAIRENPDDDMPRLAYADWLNEREDPRGEFLQVQCELARSPREDLRRAELLDRQQELRGQYGRAWAEPLLAK